jgi:hypothetical protein
MRITNSLQRRLHHRTLRKRFNTTKILPKINPKEAKTIALLFDATKNETRKIVESFAQKLRNKGKKVTLFAFFNGKEKPDLAFKFFNKKETNWYGIPKGETVEAFLNTTFDLMYCLFNEPHLPLEYVGAMAQAHFKAGSYTDDLTRYDLMIDTQNADLEELIHQIEFYLTKIGRSENELSTV